ncbi:MAG TPA: ATP-binding protein [Rudaea sp.]
MRSELFDHMTTAVAVVDADQRLVEANAAFCELLRIGAARVTGRALATLGPAAAILSSAVARVQASGGTLADRDQQLPDALGAARTSVDILATALADAHTLLEIHRLAPDAPAPAARWSQTLRGLAHEIKNPLAGVRGAAQLLGRRAVDGESGRLAALIVSEADRLAALADRLLHARAQPRIDAVNLHEVLERARALIVAEAAEPVSVERDYDPSLPALHGDGDRLLQLVLNLLRNALQADAKSIQIRTRAERNVRIGDGSVRLAMRLDVSDNGRGVPESLRETLFLPLVSGRADGSGLGLALAQEIAHEHGGALRHDEARGRTVFTLLLPLENNAHG